MAAGAGAILYLEADREPSLGAALALAIGLGIAAWFARGTSLLFIPLVAVCALAAGMVSASWRSARVAAPVLDHIRIATLEGFIEEMDFRREGARFLLRLSSAEGMKPQDMPYRVRLTIRRAPPFEAGTYVRLKARLLPPAHASLPGGYDFARDAWFMRLGGVGNVLGKIDVAPPPAPPGSAARRDDGDRPRPQCLGTAGRPDRRRRCRRHRGGHGDGQARSSLG